MAQRVKNQPVMQETQVRFLGLEDPLKKGMATHSSNLAWRIPWTEEPGGLQPMGSQRIRHDWSTNILTFHTPRGRGSRVLETGAYCVLPRCQLRIKVTFLFPPNSDSVFFIPLRWAEKAKLLAATLSMQGVWVWSLAGELRTHMMSDVAETKYKLQMHYRLEH